MAVTAAGRASGALQVETKLVLAGGHGQRSRDPEALALTSGVMKGLPGRGALVALAARLSTRGAGAADVELAPFAGVQFPGSVASAAGGRPFSIGIGLDYGATMDVAMSPGWRVELLYSRQATELSSRGGGARYGLVMERYLAGIEEETGDLRTRFVGVFLAGLTRFAPGLDSYDSDVHLTLGLSLGVKRWLSERFGLRMAARGFLVDVDSGGGVVCSGSCLFVLRGSGLWQAT